MQNANFKIEDWLKSAALKLDTAFKGRLLFIGLQGSYARDEATKDSDIDLVVILDKLKFEDLRVYRSIINSLPHSDLACGFISGKGELQKWSKADLFQFFYDTKPLFGSLNNIIQPPKTEDIKLAVKAGAENLYHASVHSFVHSVSHAEDLQNLYKMTFFILQAKYFVETKEYAQTKKALLERLSGVLPPAFSKTDKEILEICIKKDEIPYLSEAEIESLYEKLITWAKGNI